MEDLRAGLVRGVKLLTPQQQVGLRHHEEFQLRMPREEAVAIGEMVTAAAEAACPGCTAQVVGSFRRGKPTCGDVDVLISPSEAFIVRPRTPRCAATLSIRRR